MIGLIAYEESIASLPTQIKHLSLPYSDACLLTAYFAQRIPAVCEVFALNIGVHCTACLLHQGYYQGRSILGGPDPKHLMLAAVLLASKLHSHHIRLSDYLRKLPGAQEQLLLEAELLLLHAVSFRVGPMISVQLDVVLQGVYLRLMNQSCLVRMDTEDKEEREKKARLVQREVEKALVSGMLTASTGVSNGVIGVSANGISNGVSSHGIIGTINGDIPCMDSREMAKTVCLAAHLIVYIDVTEMVTDIALSKGDAMQEANDRTVVNRSHLFEHYLSLDSTIQALKASRLLPSITGDQSKDSLGGMEELKRVVARLLAYEGVDAEKVKEIDQRYRDFCQAFHQHQSKQS